MSVKTKNNGQTEFAARTLDDEEAKRAEGDEDEENRTLDDDEENRDGDDEDEENRTDDDEDEENRDGDDEDEENRDGDEEDEEKRFAQDDDTRASARPKRSRKMIAKRARLAERKRVGDIEKMAGKQIPRRLVRQAVADGWSTGKASERFLGYIVNGRAMPVGVSQHSRGHDADCTADALAGGLALRMGRTLIPGKLSDRHPYASERAALIAQAERKMELGSQYRHMPLVDICREALRIAGEPVPRNPQEIAQRAFSTAALSNIMTTNINALLINTYEEAKDTTQGWVRERDVTNYKLQERFRQSVMPNLRKRPRGTEADHGTREDSVERYKLADYAEQFVIDDQDIVDDDLNAFIDLPMQMGAAAARLKPDMAYSILLANTALGADSIAVFDSATHANLTTAVLGTTGLEAAIAAVAKQTETIDGNVVNLNVRGTHLVLPVELALTADVLLNSPQRVIASASGGTKNPLLDLDIQIHGDNRLGAQGVTDPDTGTAFAGSATNWFLLGDGEQYPTIEIGYLAGTGRLPELTSERLPLGHYGMGFAVRLAIAAKALDFRAMHKSTGAG